MIEYLDGIRETVNYDEIKGFKLYDNRDFESIHLTGTLPLRF